MSIFTIFYRFSRFTHICRDLHFFAIYALFPQFFLAKIAFSVTSHVFCMYASLLQLMIWRGRPLAINFPGGPTLRMIIRHPCHPSSPCQDPVSILRTFLEQLVLVAFVCNHLHAAHHRTVYLAPSPVHSKLPKVVPRTKKNCRVQQ